MYRLSDVIETVEANLFDPNGRKTVRDERPDGTTARKGEGISPSVWEALYTFLRLPEAVVRDVTAEVGSIDVVDQGEKSDLRSLPSEAQWYLGILKESWRNQDHVVVIPISQYPIKAVGRILEPGDVELLPDLRNPVDVGESFERRYEPGDGGTAKPRLMWHARRPEDFTAYNLSIWEQPADASEPVSTNPETQTSSETPNQSRDSDKVEFRDSHG